MAEDQTAANPAVTPEAAPPAKPTATAQATAQVKYVGPPEQTTAALSDVEGVTSTTPEPGKTYEVPAELAEALAASSGFWQAA